jgi:hypothetical protein
MTATGPHKNTYIIPQLVLGNSFKEWQELTNNDIVEKLNRLKIYTADGNSGITTSVDDDGILTVSLETIIPDDHTFTGNITFNGQTTTINSNDVTIDDYTLVLGHTGPSGSTLGYDDDYIQTNYGGGGIILRGSDSDKELLWMHPLDAWVSSENFALTGGKAIASIDNRIRFREYNGSGLSGGIQIGFTSGSSGDQRDVLIAYTTADDISGTTQEAIRITEEGFVEITNGVNRKRINQTGHGFTFGHVIRREYTTHGGYTLADANDTSSAEVVGVVSRVVNVDCFDLTFSGEVVTGNSNSWSSALISGSTLSPGQAYFLSKDEQGKITTTPPIQPGKIRKVVLIALDEDRGLVVNYIGHEIPDETAFNAVGFSVRKLVNQVNNFVEGDIVRFDSTQLYGLSGASDAEFTGITYEHGTYQRASAETAALSEVIGIVSDTVVAGDPNKFFITTSGFFNLDSSLTADGAGYTAGKVYYLKSGATGYADVQLSEDEPTTMGYYSKALLFSTSLTDGYLLNRPGELVKGTYPVQNVRYYAGASTTPIALSGSSGSVLKDAGGATSNTYVPGSAVSYDYTWYDNPDTTTDYITLGAGIYSINAHVGMNVTGFTCGNLYLTAESTGTIYGADSIGVSGSAMQGLTGNCGVLNGDWNLEISGATANIQIKAYLNNNATSFTPNDRIINITRYNN